MTFNATKAKVFNRGVPPNSFLTELVEWGRKAPGDIFAPNPFDDIYGKITYELATEVHDTDGSHYTWESALHRRAAMLEVMRVLAGFESGWDWEEGVDTSKSVSNTASNAEAGAWQTSYDARTTAPGLVEMLSRAGIKNGIAFQRKMKEDHEFAMEFVARLMRKNARHNGPLYKGAERKATWPRRPKLWSVDESIYPWLSRAAVAEFETLLA